jgi:glycosyltransferase involved in cell wall biosynthesis
MAANSPQTVLLVSHTSFPGGAERSLLELARVLLARGEFQPVLACPADGDLSDKAAALGLDALPYDPPRVEGRGCIGRAVQGLCAPEGVRTLRAHIAHSGARLLHANGLKAFALGSAAARWAGIPCLFHARDYPRHPRLLRALHHRADATIAASRFMAQALREALRSPESRIAVAPNPIAPWDAVPEAAARLRAEWGISPETRVVTMIAQLVPWKRHDLFLDAAAILQAARNDAHFILVGSNPWNADTALAKRISARINCPNLCRCVTDAGQRNDVQAVLAASDVLVLPSDREPFGRVVVEAWWAGVPVVVSDCGGPAELVRDGLTGLHFAQGNAASLAGAVERLLHNPELRATLAANARREAARYLPEIHAAAVEAVYRSLLA